MEIIIMPKKSASWRVPTKFFFTKDDFETFIEEEKSWMYSRIIKSIEYAWKNGHDEAHILDAKIEDSMTIISMNSSRSEWVNSLELALEWYSGEEKYEQCADLLKLINKIRTDTQSQI
jgi:hypothetical protein